MHDAAPASTARDLPLIHLEGVAKTFALPDGRRLEAVKPTSLEIGRRDVFGMVGKSGAGKATLLRLINSWSGPIADEYRRAGSHGARQAPTARSASRHRHDLPAPKKTSRSM